MFTRRALLSIPFIHFHTFPHEQILHLETCICSYHCTSTRHIHLSLLISRSCCMTSNASFVDLLSQISSCCHWELSDTHLRHRLKVKPHGSQRQNPHRLQQDQDRTHQRSEWLFAHSQNTDRTAWLVREKAMEGIILAIWRPKFSAARKIFIRGEKKKKKEKLFGKGYDDLWSM